MARQCRQLKRFLIRPIKRPVLALAVGGLLEGTGTRDLLPRVPANADRPACWCGMGTGVAG
jgi:hypothetical protein